MDTQSKQPTLLNTQQTSSQLAEKHEFTDVELSSQAPGIIFKPSEKQRALANSIANLEDTRSIHDKAKDLGISHYQLSAWLTQSVFIEYINLQLPTITDAYKATVWGKLLSKINKEDTRAIELYFKLKKELEQKPSTLNQTQINIFGSNDELLKKAISENIELPDNVKQQIAQYGKSKSNTKAEPAIDAEYSVNGPGEAVPTSSTK